MCRGHRRHVPRCAWFAQTRLRVRVTAPPEPVAKRRLGTGQAGAMGRRRGAFGCGEDAGCVDATALAGEGKPRSRQP